MISCKVRKELVESKASIHIKHPLSDVTFLPSHMLNDTFKCSKPDLIMDDWGHWNMIIETKNGIYLCNSIDFEFEK
tara:strand:+ start:2121 stop:2348 length:228 start_codon:yes stop_codon:yes gene_type:complete